MADDHSEEIATLRATIAARDKTIAALVRRVEGSPGTTSAFAVLEQNISLERIVRKKTAELEAQRAELARTLGQLQETQDQLVHAQKMEAVGRLASGVAHEINTPIQFIADNLQYLKGAFADLAAAVNALERIAADAGEPYDGAGRAALSVLRDDDLLVEVPRAVAQALEGTARVTSLVRALKAFSHPGGVALAPADLAAIATTAIGVSRNEWRYVADLTTEFDPTLPPVPCMQTELTQVLLNLIVNAAHAIGDRSPATRGRIVVSTQADGRYALIRVADDGPGIPEAARARVFEPFFTTKALGKGTGQGLAIAYDVIVKRHGGTISFETEEGRGTTFLIRLPVTRGSSPPGSAP